MADWESYFSFNRNGPRVVLAENTEDGEHYDGEDGGKETCKFCGAEVDTYWALIWTNITRGLFIFKRLFTGHYYHDDYDNEDYICDNSDNDSGIED